MAASAQTWRGGVSELATKIAVSERCCSLPERQGKELMNFLAAAESYARGCGTETKKHVKELVKVTFDGGGGREVAIGAMCARSAGDDSAVPMTEGCPLLKTRAEAPHARSGSPRRVQSNNSSKGTGHVGYGLRAMFKRDAVSPNLCGSDEGSSHATESDVSSCAASKCTNGKCAAWMG